ncbi:TRAP transporter small permease [Ottowia sp.]|uniref:TRAP transporter small permease n=1 Tax=Ottowia sp. TaxID=1898956 RepID=UPI001DE6B530|nr:TRAP transporter small permease [Ottowia sp.]MCB2032453.1 TRAP transporter small permease [Ottowia sp.]MCP5257137.1 TRAP transporter small permease [Burkholderiaceae bacterium]HPK31183.1 TRAP transporter small permease [Ottowia sp.]HPR43701.1 TRAP transporter small permease [Ottowia sp.]
MNRWIYGLARGLAWVGGLVLVALTVMSVVSILGRAASSWGLGPVPGDFELVEAGTAVAVFCFMPWCHLMRGHAVVDILWRAYPPFLQRLLNALSQLLMFGVWVLLTWRMAYGLQDYYENGETSFILHMPVWWGYALCMVAALLGCLVYLWALLESLGAAKPPEEIEFSGGGH